MHARVPRLPLGRVGVHLLRGLERARQRPRVRRGDAVECRDRHAARAAAPQQHGVMHGDGGRRGAFHTHGAALRRAIACCIFVLHMHGCVCVCLAYKWHGSNLPPRSHVLLARRGVSTERKSGMSDFGDLVCAVLRDTDAASAPPSPRPRQRCCLIQKDLEHLVTGSYDGTIAVWDIRAGGGQHPSLISRWLAHTPPPAGEGTAATLPCGDPATAASSTPAPPLASPPPQPTRTDLHNDMHVSVAIGRDGGSAGVVRGSQAVGGMVVGCDGSPRGAECGCMESSAGPAEGGRSGQRAGDGVRGGNAEAGLASALADAGRTVVALAGADGAAATGVPRPSAIAAAAAAAAVAAYPAMPFQESSAGLVGPSVGAVRHVADDSESRSAQAGATAGGAGGVGGDVTRTDDAGEAPAGDDPSPRLRQLVSFADELRRVNAATQPQVRQGEIESHPKQGLDPGQGSTARCVGPERGRGAKPLLHAAVERWAGVVPDMAMRREVLCVCFQLGGRLLCSGGADAVVRVRAQRFRAAGAARLHVHDLHARNQAHCDVLT